MPPSFSHSAATFFNTTSYGVAAAAGFAFSPDGKSILITSDQNGVFKFTGLRASTTSIQLYPASAGDDVCRGGLYTELQLVECSPWSGASLTTNAWSA